MVENLPANVGYTGSFSTRYLRTYNVSEHKSLRLCVCTCVCVCVCVRAVEPYSCSQQSRGQREQEDHVCVQAERQRQSLGRSTRGVSDRQPPGDESRCVETALRPPGPPFISGRPNSGAAVR